MKVALLSKTDQVINGATHKVILNYADVAALGAATTGTIAIYPASGTFPIGTKVNVVTTRITADWDASDTAINSLLIEIGDGGGTDRLLTQTELAVDGTEIVHKVMAAATAPYIYNAADTVDALFTVAGGATPLLSEVNAGEVEIYLNVTTPTLDMRAVRGPLA